jgi:uncharacterized protein YfiM (DUF2279 family)
MAGPLAAARVQRAKWLRRTNEGIGTTVLVLSGMVAPTRIAAQPPHNVIRPIAEASRTECHDPDRCRPLRMCGPVERTLAVADRRKSPRAGCPPVLAQARDRWFAEDKVRHFFTSYGVAALGYGSTRLVGFGHHDAMKLSLAGAAVAGIGKEVLDVRRGGPFSLRDLVYDAAGIAVAGAILHNMR